MGEEELQEPGAADVIEALEKRLGVEGVDRAVGECLRALDRRVAVYVMNQHLASIRLPGGADRGRMRRLLVQGMERRSTAALDTVQALARTPFENAATREQQQSLDEAVGSLNDARGGTPEERLSAARRVVEILQSVIEPEAVRRLLVFNAFPDTVDVLLEAAAGAESE